MKYSWVIVAVCNYLVYGLRSSNNQETIYEAEGRLISSLFENYDKRVIPQVNETTPANVSISLKLINLVELIEHEQVLETNVYLQQIWTDYRLAWDPSDYKRTIELHVPVADMWQPDIELYNNADVGMDGMYPLAILFNTGQVYYSPRVRLRTLCRLDMTKFPFDQQVCKIKMGSFTYSGNRIGISDFPTPEAFDLADHQANNEWEIMSTSSEIKTKYYPCCHQPFQHVEFVIRLKRNTVYYTHVFILPAVILALIVPFQFLLPPDSKERLTIGSSLLLGIILLITMIQGFLPEAHPTLPYLVQYYCVTMVWIALSLLLSIWMVNIQSRRPSSYKLPDVIRQIFLKTLKKLVCLNEDNYYPLDEVESVSLRSLEKQIATNDTTKGDGDKLVRDIEEIQKNVNNLLVRSMMADSRAHAQTEWYQVALVFDRVMCFLFLLAFVIYSCVLLA